MVRKPGGPGYEIKMLTDRIVNRSFELADILDWGFPIKSSELAGGNLESTLKEILGPELGLFFDGPKFGPSILGSFRRGVFITTFKSS